MKTLKERALDVATNLLLSDLGNENCLTAVELLQEIANAPEPEPVMWKIFDEEWEEETTLAKVAEQYKKEGHTVIAYYTAPPAPSVPVGTMENIALDEWLDKTEWVQKEINTFPVSSLGMHRADVMRLEIERLREMLAAPAPNVPDGWRSAIAKEFPLYDEDGLDEDKHCCERVMLQERKRLHKILATPTPAERTNVAEPDVWRLVCGDWKDTTVAIHNNAGYIACGLDPAKAKTLVDAHNSTLPQDNAAMLAAAPTPAEPPTQDFEDALEQAFWDFDAWHKGYKKTIRPISERDAFKQVLRNFMHEHGGAEAPADVARDAERYRWLREENAKLNLGFYVGNGTDWVGANLDEAIDAAIDAAIAAEKGGA